MSYPFKQKGDYVYKMLLLQLCSDLKKSFFTDSLPKFICAITCDIEKMAQTSQGAYIVVLDAHTLNAKDNIALPRQMWAGEGT